MSTISQLHPTVEVNGLHQRKIGREMIGCLFLMALSIISFLTIGAIFSIIPLLFELGFIESFWISSLSSIPYVPESAVISGFYCLIAVIFLHFYLKTRLHKYADDIEKLCLGWSVFGLLISTPTLALLLFSNQLSALFLK